LEERRLGGKYLDQSTNKKKIMKNFLVVSLMLFAVGSITPSIAVKAQRIDTVLVRNLPMQIQDWTWFYGKLGMQKDSTFQSALRRVRAKILSTPGATMTTVVTVDSLPGPLVYTFYIAIRASAGENVSRYGAIVSAITSKTNLAYWIGLIDGRYDAARLSTIQDGKSIIIDNQ
jgi:hypothetical protein